MSDILRPNEQEWASYLPALMTCLLATDGPVLEVGMGKWSTPILRAFCGAAKRKLVSLEANPDFAHYTSTVDAYDMTVPIAAGLQWSVVFLDHSPGERRAADAVMFHDCAEYIVVHDFADANVDLFAPHMHLWRRYEIHATFPPRTLVLVR